MNDEEIEDLTKTPENPLKGTKSQVSNAAKEKAGKEIKKQARKLVEKGAKAASKTASSSSIAAFFATPVGWVVLIIILVIILAIYIVGFIGFFFTMPGLTKEKISGFYEKTIKNLYTSSTEDPPIEVSNEAKLELANYIDGLGYNVVGYGFLDSVTRDSDGKITDMVASKNDYIYAYILANERTYSLENYKMTDWNKFLNLLKTYFLPGFYYAKIVNALLPSDPHEKAHTGMLDVDGWASGITGQIFDSMYIERNKDDSQDVKLIVKRWNISEAEWWNPFTWLTIDTFSWNMDGWTPRYGKPIELSLALHLSTMAPDLAYDFCMDDDLQASVRIKTKDITYNAEYKYTTGPDAPTPNVDITESEINKVYNDLIKEMAAMSYLNKADTGGNIIYAKDDASGPVLPTNIFRNLSVVHVVQNGYDEYQKLVDENGNPIQIVDERGNDIFSGNYAWDVSAKGFKRVNATTPELTILTGHYNNSDSSYSWGLPSYLKVTIKNPSVDDIARILQTNDWNAIENKFDTWMNNLAYHARNTIDAYIDGIREPRMYQYREGFASSYEEEFAGLYWQASRDKNAAANRLKVIRTGILKDYDNALEEYKQQVLEDSVELKNWQVGFDVITALHELFEKSPRKLKTYQPYISYVRNHWYKDVLFEPTEYLKAMGEDYVTQETKDAIQELKDANYIIYDYKNKEKMTMPFEPEVESEELRVIQESSGQLYVDLIPEGTQVVQVNQPLVISNEPHHMKFKSWLTDGYFFMYDGNIKTAENIKVAKEYLKEKGLYNSEDPLLGESNSNLIDAKAEKVNKALEDAEKNGVLEARAKAMGYEYKKPGVRLQKISFEKNSALNAFSILESIHTRDAEYVYRDLKELMIDLGYFKRSDFASIELGVLEWIIPEYKPEDWPMKRYEKDDNNYETLILSRKTIDELKQKEGEAEEEFDPTKVTEAESKNKKITCDGFDGGLKIIAPENCKVKKVETEEDGTNSITLKFTAANKVKNFTLKISGITTTLNEKDVLNKNDLLGYTVDGVDIKLLLKDSVKAVVSNIEDYMNTKRRKFGIDADYAKLFFTVYEGGQYEGENTGPDCRGMMGSSNEEAFGICQWTLVHDSKMDALTSFLQSMYDKDPAFCREFKAYIGLPFDELWNKAGELHETLKRMARSDREYLVELEMTCALETFYDNRYLKGNAAWILDKPDPVIATYFSIINWRPGLDWVNLAKINKDMSDEEIIKRLAGSAARESKEHYLQGRMESQAKLAIDMLRDASISPRKFCYEGHGAYPGYANGQNSGYLSGYI